LVEIPARRRVEPEPVVANDPGDATPDEVVPNETEATPA
jgi:hypothetical protein